MWSRASSFKWEYPLLSLRPSSSLLRLLPRLPLTSIPPFIFPSITRCRRQFLCKMWPIQLAFRLLISCRMFFCYSNLSNTSSFLTWSVQVIFSILLRHQISNLSRYCGWKKALNFPFIGRRFRLTVAHFECVVLTAKVFFNIVSLFRYVMQCWVWRYVLRYTAHIYCSPCSKNHLRVVWPCIFLMKWCGKPTWCH